MTLKKLVPWRRGGLGERPALLVVDMFRRDMGTLHREMSRFFDDLWRVNRHPSRVPEAWDFEEVSPRVDGTEDDTAFHIRVELPGMDKEDVDVAFSEGQLTIRGEKKQEDEEKGKDFYRKERAFGAFRRTLPIPAEVDESKIDATFKKGVLYIDLPKTEEAQKKVTHISVKAA